MLALLASIADTFSESFSPLPGVDGGTASLLLAGGTVAGSDTFEFAAAACAELVVEVALEEEEAFVEVCGGTSRESMESAGRADGTSGASPVRRAFAGRSNAEVDDGSADEELIGNADSCPG
jgi:hypothetical protein